MTDTRQVKALKWYANAIETCLRRCGLVGARLRPIIAQPTFTTFVVNLDTVPRMAGLLRVLAKAVGFPLGQVEVQLIVIIPPVGFDDHPCNAKPSPDSRSQ